MKKQNNCTAKSRRDGALLPVCFNLRTVSVILFSLFLISCIDTDLPRVNGMWQLKSVSDENGGLQTVDTLYFSFQRQAIFSYTVMNASGNSASVIYGYVDFPEDGILHIQLDKRYEEKPPSTWRWKDTSVTFYIEKINSKELILRQEGMKYNFIKF
ncbi:hypothetical protein FACS189432_01280 [Bacteroidia bacterium]|nr:hypothetical protein FACS189426_00320 [Bacteroidia bacterium]GHT26582.1 hypothetical protein FACS189432_01280 [Bacteroidia bacterium]GHU63197.1 hypothetical protein FACS1894123_05490 [Bacteroidia bacterium]